MNTRHSIHKYHNHHAVLHKLYMWFGKNELRLLKRSKTIFDWGVPAAHFQYGVHEPEVVICHHLYCTIV